MDARKSLEKRLGDFLGFDEDDESLVDVLDQLLAIENEEDLLDYLSQLLGSRSDDIKAFVKDVNRHQNGLPIEGLVQVQEKEEAKPAKNDAPAAAPAPASAASKPTKKVVQPKPAKAKLAQPTAAAPGAKKAPPPPAPAKVDNTPSKVDPEKENAPKTEPPKKKKYGLPPKGTPQRVCGCFGTLHKPLTNCLYCGRISCAEEGYDFCPFCGYLVEEVKPPDGQSNSSKAKAWQHKERLLRYDRESAKRTVVLDDQADYYSNQNSSWLTEEEQANAEVQDGQQRNNLHQRKKQVLNIAF